MFVLCRVASLPSVTFVRKQSETELGYTIMSSCGQYSADQRKYINKEGNRGIRGDKMSPILWFKLLWVLRETSPAPPLTPPPNSLLIHTHIALYMYTQTADWYLRSHESLKSKLGDIFRRHTLVFPTSTIYFLSFVPISLSMHIYMFCTCTYYKYICSCSCSWSCHCPCPLSTVHWYMY
jgi:hypothetical protein